MGSLSAGRLARRPALNDPIQLIGPASLVGNSRETFHTSGTDGSNPLSSSGESDSPVDIEVARGEPALSRRPSLEIPNSSSAPLCCAHAVPRFPPSRLIRRRPIEWRLEAHLSGRPYRVWRWPQSNKVRGTGRSSLPFSVSTYSERSEFYSQSRLSMIP